MQSNKLKWLCIILVVIYTAVFIGGLFIPAKNSTEAVAKYGVMGFFVRLRRMIFISLGIMWHELRKYHPTRSAILEALETRNGAHYFVWIYPLKKMVNGASSYFIIFMGMNKKRYQVQVKTMEELAIITNLQAVITNVTYGYSDSIKTQYRKDPYSLVKH